MEDELQKSPRPGYPADTPDVKYLSGLSTVLVATIQEVKDRISQIEYIFCSQLFPNFQLKTQSLQKIYSDAREAAEDAYKEKEKDLLLQIKELQCEKQQVMGEKALNEWRQVHKNLQKVLDSKESLILQHENTIKVVEEKNIVILKKQLFLVAENEKLQLELVKKSEEVDEVMKVLNKLLQINQSSASLQKGMQLKEYEEKANEFISELENKRWKFDELLSGLREKTQEVENGKKLRENLLKKIECQASEIMNNEQLVEENSLLTSKMGSLMNCVDELKKELLKKNNDLEEDKKVQEQLLLQIDSFSFERAKRGTELEESENERRLLLDKQKVLEETIDYLQQIISEKSKEPSIKMELHEKLLQQHEAKDSELLSEKRKYQELIARYKKLKSQYNFACKKLDLTPETTLSHNKIEDDNEKFRHDQCPATSRVSDIENKASKAVDAASEVTKPREEQELLPDNERSLLVERTNPESSSTTSTSVSPKRPSGIKSYLPGGAKRPISYWRDTRSHQSRLGPDPHDDFLDTPLENVKENRGKVTGETHKCPKQDLKNMKFSNSVNDDETQDMNVDPEPRRRQMSPSTRGTSGFKYTEPVRKKSDRESLKGMECKQCKKFYDAVLLNGEENSDGNWKNIRCEHHNEVSRHRYRFAPPLTPEGFWNIGFESEM